MKIGIISDTHGRIDYTKKALKRLEQENISHLIHAGDIGNREILDLMRDFDAHCTAVFGNNDATLREYQERYNLFYEPHYFKLDGKKIKLMHIPYYLTADSDIIIYGHLHKFQAEFIKGRLFINPGEICARSKPVSEFATVEIKESGYEVEYF
jgi:putative phosphoesterase